MEKSTNKLTNGQLDRLIIESTHSMNSLGIQIPYSYFNNLVKLNWYDILFAIQNAYLPFKSAIDHALKEIEENVHYHEVVLELAMLSPNDINLNYEIDKYIVQLAELVSDDDKCETNEKMLFCLLNWIFECQKEYDDPLRVVEIIYDDFEHPDLVRSFVRYEPSPYTVLNSQDENINRLYSNWKDYLKAEAKKYT